MSKTKKATLSTGDALAQLTSKWTGRHEAGIKNQEKIFRKAAENYKIFYAETPDEEKAKSPWKSNVFLPLLPGKARDTKAKMSVIEPRFRVIPADSWEIDPETGELNFDKDALIKSLKVTKKLNRDFINHTSIGGLPPRASLDYSVTDAIVAGWGLALAPLKTYRKTYKTHEALMGADGEPSAYVDMSKTNTKQLLRSSTDLVPLDIFRVYGSPKMKSWEASPWIIIERDETYTDLDRCNSTKGEMVYDLPPSLKTATPNNGPKNKYSAVRDASLGYLPDGSDAIDDSVNSFLVLDCYDQQENKFYTFVKASVEEAVNGWLLIREMENPYNHGLVPVIPVYVKRRPNSPWGESFFEIAKEVQYAYNAGFNQFRDNATLSTETMAIIDKSSIIGSYEVGPGNTIEYDSLNGEKPEAWKLTDPNPAVLNAQMQLLEKAAEYGTTPQYNSGQVDSSMDKTAGTRGGIEMLMEAANDKVSEMVRELKSSLMRYGYIALHNAQQYQNYIEVLDAPVTTPKALSGEAAQKPDYLTPMELQEAYDLEVDDESMMPLSRSERRRMFLDFMDMMIKFNKASTEENQAFDTPDEAMRLDWPDIMKELGSQFGELNAPAFIKEPITREKLAIKKVQDAAIDQHAADTAAKIATQNNPDSNVSQDPNGIRVEHQQRELINFKDVPNDAKNSVLNALGYPSSQIVQESAKAELATAKATQLDTQVKEQMITAATAGKLDPTELSKFIKK